MSTARILRIKSAQKQLIYACEGAETVVDTFNYARSTVFRWADLNDPTLMPLNVVLTLEAHCGSPLVTAAMAEVGGRRLADPDQFAKATGSVLSHHSDAIAQAAELMQAGALAFADGKVSINEAISMDRSAQRLEAAVCELRKSLADVHAAGGLSVVSGGRDQ